jgi:hypothetical protein
MGMPEGNRPLGRTRSNRQYNIKMDVVNIGWGSMNWINLSQVRDQ